MVQRNAAGGEALPIGFELVPAPPSITINSIPADFDLHQCRALRLCNKLALQSEDGSGPSCRCPMSLPRHPARRLGKDQPAAGGSPFASGAAPDNAASIRHGTNS